MALEAVATEPQKKEKKNKVGWLRRAKEKASNLFTGENENKTKETKQIEKEEPVEVPTPEPEVAPQPPVVEEKPQENNIAGATETVETTTVKQPENQDQPAEGVLDEKDGHDNDDFFKLDGKYQPVPDVPHESSEQEIMFPELKEVMVVSHGESLPNDDLYTYVHNRNLNEGELDTVKGSLAKIKGKIKVNSHKSETYVDMVQDMIDSVSLSRNMHDLDRELRKLSSEYNKYAVKVKHYGSGGRVDEDRLRSFKQLRDLNKNMHSAILDFMTSESGK